MNRRWRITGRFTTTSPLHVGDGDVVTHDKIQDQDGNKADVARVTRDWKTRPCIPGTAVKGVLRSWADWFFPQHKPAISKMFGTRDAAELMGEAGWAEFGTLFLQTPAPVVLERFDKYLPYWHKERLTGIASHVCINRHTGAAQKNKLYYEEFVPEGVVFNVEITATRLSETDIDLLLAILEQGARHPSHPYQFGANGADGWGRMDWTLGEVMTCGEVPTGRRAIGFGCCTTPYAHGELPKAGGPPAHQFLELTLAFEGPLLVNDASRAKEDGPEDARTNHTAMSRANGHVWLPASTFRGALRQRAEFLLRSLDPEATGDPNAPAGNGPIERIFGATSQASRLQIDEFTEIGKCPRPEERPKQDFVAIDRFTGGAADGLKFDARYADRPTLGTKMVLDTTGLDGKDLALFAAALEDLCAGAAPLGFGGSKGYGSCRGKLDAKSTTWLRGLDRSGLKPTEAAFQPTTTAQAVAAVQPTATVQPVAVATVKQGRLVWEGAGKTRRQSLAHQDGKTIYQLTPQRIRQDLRGVPDASVEVDYELERGQPIHIRPRGEPWEQAPKPGAGNNPAPASRSDRFANPYYFLPMKDRSALSGELKDRVPHGHERLISDLYSGSLRVRLTTETELLICGQPEKPELNGNGHQTYPLLLQDGKPLLASSSVRGMLRAAYEAVTNSRFGVFPAKPTADSILKRGNARRYGYRMEAGEGLGLVPVRMENGQARLMLGTNPHLPTWDHRKGRWEVPHGRLHAAWVARYKATGGAAERAVTINGRSPVHGEEAWCWLELVQHKNPFFQFWTVRQAASNEAALGQVAPPWIINGSPRYQSLEESRRAHGHFCVTNQNIGRKHDERFFFGPIEPLVRVRDDVKTAYEALIADYQAIHEEELKKRRRNGREPFEFLGADIGKTAFSRHVYQTEDLRLTDGALCHARVEKHEEGYRIDALYPVIISRKVHPASPWDLLPDTLRPATRFEALSPADRVFGWVSQDETTIQDGETAYRSQLRVGPVTCVTPDPMEAHDPPRTLAILSQPKPQQGRFYLGKRDGSAQQSGKSKAEAGYKEGNWIRGPKVYPHHASGVRKENAFSEERSDQNRSITGCVRRGVSFELDLSVTNLSQFELGALIWLLSLPESHFLRLGLGKPLGFGSVRAETVQGGEKVAAGAEWIAKIGSSDPPTFLSQTELSDLATTFVQNMTQANGGLLGSFLKAARGFGDLPIHYPRLAGQDAGSGEHYQWFVENEKGGKQSLPDLLAEDPSLPRNP